jgi:hypothetical protein
LVYQLSYKKMAYFGSGMPALVWVQVVGAEVPLL